MYSTQTESDTTTGKLLSLQLNANVTYGCWRDDFFNKGYHALDWLCSFDNDIDLNDKSTWNKEHLPQSFRHMYLNYCAAHEKYMWDARTEPGIIKRFEELWSTKGLLVSFDTAPERQGLACVQGLLNLAPAGPKDGGLLLMVGWSKLVEEFFTTHSPRDRGNVIAKHYDYYGFNQEEIAWFESKGCHQMKDSRNIHHVALPESDTIRTILYTCFTPRALAKPEDIAYKAELFGRWEATTHWLHCSIWGHAKAMVDGKLDPLERNEPLEKPEKTEQILKLAGVKPY